MFVVSILKEVLCLTRQPQELYFDGLKTQRNLKTKKVKIPTDYLLQSLFIYNMAANIMFKTITIITPR